MNLERIRALSGQDTPKQVVIAELKIRRDALVRAFDLTIKQVEVGARIDENAIFQPISAALKAASQVAKKGGKAAAEKAEGLSPKLKDMYVDDEVQGELKQLMDACSRVNHVLTGLDRDAPKIMAKDSEVKTILGLLKDVMVKLIDELAQRSAVPLAANESAESTEAPVIGESDAAD